MLYLAIVFFAFSVIFMLLKRDKSWNIPIQWGIEYPQKVSGQRYGVYMRQKGRKYKKQCR